MTNAIPFGDWLDQQGDDVWLAMYEGHPETLILVDTTNMGVYKYVPAENQDGAHEATSEFLRKRMHELRSIAVSVGMEMPQAATLMMCAADAIDRLDEENAELRELCADLYLCSDPCNDCPHYNGSSSGFYCDFGIGWKARRMRELGIEVGA